MPINWDEYDNARKEFIHSTKKRSLHQRFVGLKIILPLFAVALAVIFLAILFVSGKASFNVGKAAVFFAIGSTLSAAGILLIGWRDIEFPKIRDELVICKNLVMVADRFISHYDSKLENQKPWLDRKREVLDTREKALKRKKALSNTEFVTRHTGRIGSAISVSGIFVMAFANAESSTPLQVVLGCPL